MEDKFQRQCCYFSYDIHATSSKQFMHNYINQYMTGKLTQQFLSPKTLVNRALKIIILSAIICQISCFSFKDIHFYQQNYEKINITQSKRSNQTSMNLQLISQNKQSSKSKMKSITKQFQKQLLADQPSNYFSPFSPNSIHNFDIIKKIQHSNKKNQKQKQMKFLQIPLIIINTSQQTNTNKISKNPNTFPQSNSPQLTNQNILLLISSSSAITQSTFNLPDQFLRQLPLNTINIIRFNLLHTYNIILQFIQKKSSQQKIVILIQQIHIQQEKQKQINNVFVEQLPQIQIQRLSSQWI